MAQAALTELSPLTTLAAPAWGAAVTEVPALPMAGLNAMTALTEQETAVALSAGTARVTAALAEAAAVMPAPLTAGLKAAAELMEQAAAAVLAVCPEGVIPAVIAQAAVAGAPMYRSMVLVAVPGASSPGWQRPGTAFHARMAMAMLAVTEHAAAVELSALMLVNGKPPG